MVTHFKEEYKATVFQTSVMKKIFGPNMDYVTEG